MGLFKTLGKVLGKVGKAAVSVASSKVIGVDVTKILSKKDKDLTKPAVQVQTQKKTVTPIYSAPAVEIGKSMIPYLLIIGGAVVGAFFLFGRRRHG